jgi:uncharacterized coiled-coil DUF342 family protein
MSNSADKPFNIDPEIEALLVGLPLDMQRDFRSSIESVRPILTSDEWEKMRISYINDIKTQLGKKQLMDEMTEVKEKLNELQGSMDELAELKKKIEEKTDEIQKGMDKIRKDTEELIYLKKKLDSFKNE